LGHVTLRRQLRSGDGRVWGRAVGARLSVSNGSLGPAERTGRGRPSYRRVRCPDNAAPRGSPALIGAGLGWHRPRAAGRRLA